MFADPFLGIYEFYDLVTAQEHIYCKDSTNYDAVIDLDSLQSHLKPFMLLELQLELDFLLKQKSNETHAETLRSVRKT